MTTTTARLVHATIIRELGQGRVLTVTLIYYLDNENHEARVRVQDGMVLVESWSVPWSELTSEKLTDLGVSPKLAKGLAAEVLQWFTDAEFRNGYRGDWR